LAFQSGARVDILDREHPMAGKKKILLVDDSSTALMMEQLLLGRTYDLVTAKDGAEALKVALAERPDLILLDVVMPKMDGFEVCRVLRGIEAMKSTPIIMVTTRGEGKNVEAGFASGASDYVTKPINQAELLAKIQRHLGAGGG
jgi:DNA-binding response OmpR family regulator